MGAEVGMITVTGTPASINIKAEKTVNSVDAKNPSAADLILFLKIFPFIIVISFKT